MNKSIPLTLVLLSCLILFSCAKKTNKKVLLFSKTAEFRHTSIEKGIESLTQLFEMNGIDVDTTENAEYFIEDSLKQYSAVIFLSTTGNVLNDIQQTAFQRYIQAGGGFVGIHSATDTEYHWPWYNKLVGAYFDGHPPIQDAILEVIAKEDPCCRHLPESWALNEEWYNFKSINPNVEVLLEIDESSYEGGKNGAHHPMAWRHHFDGGRSFYTALGHKEETFDNVLFLQHIFAGVEFAMGENKLDYTNGNNKTSARRNHKREIKLDLQLEN